MFIYVFVVPIVIFIFFNSINNKGSWSSIATIITLIVLYGGWYLIHRLNKDGKFDKIKLFFLKKKQKREKIEYPQNVKELWKKYRNKENELMSNGGEIIGNDDYIINKIDNKLLVFRIIKDIAELNSLCENGKINSNIINETIINIDFIKYYKNENSYIKVVLNNNDIYNFNKISIYEYLSKQFPNKNKNDIKSEVNKVRIVDKL